MVKRLFTAFLHSVCPCYFGYNGLLSSLTYHLVQLGLFSVFTYFWILWLEWGLMTTLPDTACRICRVDDRKVSDFLVLDYSGYLVVSFPIHESKGLNSAQSCHGILWGDCRLSCYDCNLWDLSFGFHWKGESEIQCNSLVQVLVLICKWSASLLWCL